jgi:tetratricopeptide (TPR) repeat protein
MISRLAAVLLLVCSVRAAEAAQESSELNNRLRLVEAERLHGSLTAAELMLADVQAEIERKVGECLLLAIALKEHALLRDDEGRPEEAIPLYERSLAMFRALPGVNPVVIGVLLANLAGARADIGNPEAALSLSTQAMSLVPATLPESAIAIYSHGHALHGLGRSMEALKDLRKALEIWLAAAEPDYSQIALVKEEIGACEADLGYGNRAEASLREALSIRAKVSGPESLKVGATLNNLGVILARAQRFSEGQELLSRAGLIFERFRDSELRRLAGVLANLGAVYFEERLYSKAEVTYRRQLSIEERIFGLSDIRLSATLEMLGEILYRESAYSEAGQTYGRGLALQVAALGVYDPTTQAAEKRYRVLMKKVKAEAAEAGK